MVFELFSPGLPRILANTGVEFAIYDMEHSGVGMDTIRQVMAWSRGPSPVPMVRVPRAEYHFIARALDVGALGIMVPTVETREQAELIVRSARYPPLGRRGAGFGLAHDDFERGDVAEKIARLNERTMLIAQIESVDGMANLEEIAAVEGIDVLWVGHFDLTVSMGIPARFDHPRFQEAIDRVAEVCAKHGLAAGINADDVATCKDWVDRGYRAIAYSGDHRLLAGALAEGVAGLRRALGQ
jgi:2-dehydro-3-deoxyglucarate aldolase/4-hydroxy-2-oxoheptanedioate aldolase